MAMNTATIIDSAPNCWRHLLENGSVFGRVDACAIWSLPPSRQIVRTKAHHLIFRYAVNTDNLATHSCTQLDAPVSIK